MLKKTNKYVIICKDGIYGKDIMRRLKGFTLTELMVAMAVVGILVAVVTPAIMRTRPNKNKMMIKKTFYTTEQIVSTLINDERLYPDMSDFCDGHELAEGEDPNTLYCAWGFDYDNAATFEGVNYNGNTKFSRLFASRLNVKRENGNTYFTSDGVSWNLSGTVGAWRKNAGNPGDLSNPNVGAGIGTILIDVNGAEAPNCRQNTAPCSVNDFDQYQIQVLANGKMRINPADSRAVDYATINTSIRDTVDAAGS